MVFDRIQNDLSELVGLVRESERYCTSISFRPELVTPESHALEVKRELRIAELSAQYGVKK